MPCDEILFLGSTFGFLLKMASYLTCRYWLDKRKHFKFLMSLNGEMFNLGHMLQIKMFVTYICYITF